MNKQKKRLCKSLTFTMIILATSNFIKAQPLTVKQQSEKILKTCNVKGGLIVHIGCGDGRLTAALRANESYLVQGLDRSDKIIALARKNIQSLGIYCSVSIERLQGNSLPYIDNLVNLVVSSELGTVPMSEVMRVLCPNGVAYILSNGKWTKTVKPYPKEFDEWTHYLHDSTNNAVSHDMVVGPPRRMQWVGSPRWARHHDRMSSVSACVSTAGRIFYIFDEAPPASILLPPRWSLIARDAFNGTILWKRKIDKWHTHLWPLKSGPAQLPRRLVAVGDYVYVTLSLDAPLTALDAATGKTVRTYEGTEATEEVIISDDVLFVLVNDADEKSDYDGSQRFAKAYNAKFWDEAERKLVAIRANSGEILWASRRRVLPATLAADSKHVVFHNGNNVVCLEHSTGNEVWQSPAIPRSDEIRSFYLPTLVLYEDVVIFSGGETAGLQTGSWYTSGKDTMTALSASTGKVLWKAYHPPSGYRSPEDLLVANGLVWTGETTSGSVEGVFTGRDPHTGEIKSEFSPNTDIYWFHHRCYRGKATDNYLLMSRTGTEFLDIRNEKWIPHHWVRGACLYGLMPANGMVYNPPHPCACYLESKLNGFNAVLSDSPEPRIPGNAINQNRLEKGPAYDNYIVSKTTKDEWPTYRHDGMRSGMASTFVSSTLKPIWQAKISGKLTSPVIAEGKVFVASVNAHTVYALDAFSGKQLWQFTTGGRIDSPPTIYQGCILFGSADGHVYCLRASDGILVWRFRAAPMDQRLMSFEQIESVWPVHGNVLVQNGAVYFVAGRSMFLDSGLYLWRLDPKTGKILSQTILNEHDQATGRDLQEYVSWLNMPPALPDILSSDGRLIYMRSQPFDLGCKRLPLEKFPTGSDQDRGAPPAIQNPEHSHLFSPTGFLDDSFWHRTYWMYGSTFVSGWCGYYLAGKAAPAGRILAFDHSNVYGFGRKPQYYRWTTPIEHQLFAATKESTAAETDDTKSAISVIRVAKSKSLNPTGKPLTIEAFIKAEKSGGVIIAHGGSAHGYALYLKDGRPRFNIRLNSKEILVAAKANVVGKWVHIAGILTESKELKIYVNGKLEDSTKVPELFSTDPKDAMEIGIDDGSPVGDYTGPFGFNGLIDEVRIYHRALNSDEVKSHASMRPQASKDKTSLVLWYSFDAGKTTDASGNKNNGEAEGVTPVKGKYGGALRFNGSAGAIPGFSVKHNWTKDIPLLARAMVLADNILFVAGPADLIDEPQAFRQINTPNINQSLSDQEDALQGKKGALLLAVSAADGKKLAQYNLDSSPVFDGMAGACGKLYISNINGEVWCFGDDK